jgi:hypothetical protein
MMGEENEQFDRTERIHFYEIVEAELGLPPP